VTSIRRAHSCTRKNAPRRLTPCSGRSFRSSCRAGRRAPWPARRRWRQRVTGPTAASTASSAVATPSDLAMIVGHVNRAGQGEAPRPPRGRLRSRSDISATRQPAPCSACAIPRPMPCCPPVTSAVPVMPQPPHRSDPPIASATRNACAAMVSDGFTAAEVGKHARIRDPEVGVVMRPPPGRDDATAGSSPIRAVPHWCDGVRRSNAFDSDTGKPARRSAAFSASPPAPHAPPSSTASSSARCHPPSA
jgi:hypothetical protein